MTYMKQALEDISLVRGPPTIDYTHEMKMAMLDYFAEKDAERANDGKIHASDTIGCNRLAVFRKLDPYPSITDEQSFYYSRGIAMHEFFQKRLIYSVRKTDPLRFRAEQKWEYEGITCTPDLIDIKNNRIVEIKTTNTQELPHDEPYEDHITQIKIYMAITGILQGTIFYFKMLNISKPYAQYDVSLKEYQRQRIISKLITNGKEIEEGINKQDPSIVSGVLQNPYKNWKCFKNGKPNCKYYNKCKEIDGI
jgi:hypothetical protein